MIKKPTHPFSLRKNIQLQSSFNGGRSTSKYEMGRHYQTFDLIPLPSNGWGSDKNKNMQDTAMFLSHEGLMMILHRRQHPIADKFRSWASEKLFTIRHGTQEVKEDLAAELLRMTPRVLRAALNTSATAMSAIYLFELGPVKDLRETFNIRTATRILSDPP